MTQCDEVVAGSVRRLSELVPAMSEAGHCQTACSTAQCEKKWMVRGWRTRRGEMMAARAMLACASTCDLGSQPSSDCVSNRANKMRAGQDGVNHGMAMARVWMMECGEVLAAQNVACDVILSSHLRFLRKIVFLISLTANHHQDHDSRHPSRSGTPAGHSLGMDGCRVDIGQMGGDGGRTGVRSRCGTINWASHVQGPASGGSKPRI